MLHNIKNSSPVTYIARVLAIPALICFFTISASAGKGTATAPLTHLLNLYYDLKDALVSSDAAAASKKATELLNAINGINAGSLSADESKAFSPLQDKLSYDARHISEVQDISHQREHFANLSLNMFALAKAVKISVDPVYEDYCPMQKAYWLSKDKPIKNPYYGNQMLTCGKVANTIQ
ncbi:MAG TPA: DUF3347 domain-containing protein [Chitinophagaceae bacterium]|nr:DUF3347 domain-containing protein [Chitinophagaceae bacterium]